MKRCDCWVHRQLRGETAAATVEAEAPADAVQDEEEVEPDESGDDR